MLLTTSGAAETDGPHVAYTLTLVSNVRVGFARVRQAAEMLAAALAPLGTDSSINRSGIRYEVYREADSLKLTCDGIADDLETLLEVTAGAPAYDPSADEDSVAGDARERHARRTSVERPGRQPLVGRGWGGPHAPGNGYEAILCILLRLLARLDVACARTAREAKGKRAHWAEVLPADGSVEAMVTSSPSTAAVASSTTVHDARERRELERRWLRQAASASANQLTPFGRLAGHHRQLKQYYGVLHLACRCARSSDPGRSLFAPLEAPMDYRSWMPTLKMDSFQGVHFGFQYGKDIRLVLKAVQVLRNSVRRAMHSNPVGGGPLARKLALFTWSWVYAHLAVLENYGYNTEMAHQLVERYAGALSRRSETGAVPAPQTYNATTTTTTAAEGARVTSENEAPPSIDETRMFFNLAEEPLLAGVYDLKTKGVAVYHPFQIPIVPLGAAGASAVVDADQPEHSGIADLLSVSVDGGRPDDVDAVECVVRGGTVRTRRSTEPGNYSLIYLPAPIDACLLSYLRRPIALDDERGGGVETAARAAAAVTAELEVEREAQGGVSRAPADDGTESGEMTPLTRHATTSSFTPPRYRSTRGGTATPAVATRATSSDTSTAVAAAADDADAATGGGSRLATVISASVKSLYLRLDRMLHTDAKSSPAPALIFFMHGGGFVGQSSLTHAAFLKQIAHDLPDAVILSIDYHLAPEYPYPIAVEECVFAYAWALQNAWRLGTTAERVVFSGDSAGGNLAVAVALKLHSRGMRLPDGLVLAYPALNLSMQWSPSRLLSLFDPLLSTDLLDLIVRSYIPPHADARRDPFLSPTLAATDAMLQALPPVAIVCGAFDPLLDDAAEFAHRLRTVHAGTPAAERVQLRIFDGLPHGFLNMSLGVDMASEGTRQMSRWMGEMLGIAWHGGTAATAGRSGEQSEMQSKAGERQAPWTVEEPQTSAMQATVRELQDALRDDLAPESEDEEEEETGDRTLDASVMRLESMLPNETLVLTGGAVHSYQSTEDEAVD
ncbi:hypothetical protein CDCA_CDCA02G0700 [Cyanidium caldarium]|uniref:Alpha/beta hydrolase fold-3 domain-containing protein n=1 Tax=Cyanidium caldarium TaxID=2771 RepID=A0AAV9IRG6_CYACA|nr:hypothetical protein CDCA_CDCA02G0700 [Cyanidium caldarium]